MSLNLVILSSLFLVTKTNNFVELSPKFELEVCPPEIKLIILLMTFILCSLIFCYLGVKFEPGDIETALIAYVNSSSFTALDRQICHHFIQWIVSVL